MHFLVQYLNLYSLLAKTLVEHNLSLLTNVVVVQYNETI